jgi:hypothetical protein
MKPVEAKETLVKATTEVAPVHAKILQMPIKVPQTFRNSHPKIFIHHHKSTHRTPLLHHIHFTSTLKQSCRNPAVTSRPQPKKQ